MAIEKIKVVLLYLCVDMQGRAANINTSLKNLEESERKEEKENDRQ